jgi:DNA-binding transcriptional MerR regulator
MSTTTARRNAEGTMTVSALAARAGLPAQRVRHYLRIGLLRAGRRSSNGYQLFGEPELQRLHFICAAQRLGFTLAEIGEVIRRARRGDSPCPLVREIVVRRTQEASAELARLMDMIKVIRHATRLWADLPDSVPTGTEVCRLIEAMSAHSGSPANPGTPLARGRRLRVGQVRKRLLKS